MCGWWSSEPPQRPFLLAPGTYQQKSFLPPCPLLLLMFPVSGPSVSKYTVFSGPPIVMAVTDLAKEPYKSSGKLGSSGLEGPTGGQ